MLQFSKIYAIVRDRSERKVIEAALSRSIIKDSDDENVSSDDDNNITSTASLKRGRLSPDSEASTPQKQKQTSKPRKRGKTTKTWTPSPVESTLQEVLQLVKTRLSPREGS